MGVRFHERSREHSMRIKTYREWVYAWRKVPATKEAAAQIAKSMAANKKQFYETDYANIFPCWELYPDGLWGEDPWWTQFRWRKARGKLYGRARMIAPRTNPVWDRLSRTFFDGIGNPYPPYSRRSDMFLKGVLQRECISLGIMTSDQVKEQTRVILARREPL